MVVNIRTSIMEVINKMNQRHLTFVISLIFLCFSFASKGSQNAEDTFEQLCASCHGKNLSGGMAGSLLDDQWIVDGSPDALTKIIAEGLISRGMPAWQDALSAEQIRALVIYINEQRFKATRTVVADEAQPSRVTSLGHTFDIAEVYTAPSILWALEFLPDGSFITTQRDGALYHLSTTGELVGSIQGLPEVWQQGQGGLLDVALHPDYQNNGWVYLAYSYSTDGEVGGLAIARGKINNLRWEDHQVLFASDPASHSKSGRHFGSRIVFNNGYLFFTMGERGIRPSAQDMTIPNGKVLRLHDDGRVPTDNPFVNTPDTLSAIWSFGHRNPQGMDVDPTTGLIWEAEHGPRGGDELNVVTKARNYGWPIITYGMNYDGTPMTHLTAKDGMEQPKHYWIPSIAPAGISFYNGDMFSEWKGKLLVGGMAIQDLQLFTIDGDAVTSKEIVLSDRGRIREVKVAPDGSIYLIVTIDGKGHVLRLFTSNQ